MKLTKICQKFERPKIDINDIEARVRQEILQTGVTITQGAQVAIAVGSRGIANIHTVAKATADTVKELGGHPFFVPAMGSHGTATPEGQREVLEGYGITEAYTGAPIKSSLEVVELPQEGLENKVYMDKYAYEADATIVINRVKLHTDFHGPVESGLMKMCVIGLGKHKQALEIHLQGTHGLRELMPKTARQILKHGNIILGIALAENAYDETAIIKALLPDQIEAEEMKMLDWVRENMPRLPLPKVDILLVDEFGKDISGSGMDTNIIGRIKIYGDPEPESPEITCIILSDLTEKSHGNAVGLGLADIITQKFYDKIDFPATYENGLTSNFLERIKTPVVVENEAQALQIALRYCHLNSPEEAKIIRMKNTLTVDTLWVSPRVLDEISQYAHIDVTTEEQDLLIS
ncbi:DUF2088 domain-containing protein [candidate division KSB3 bacterium]|uniref:DUF2088 domain-containing protein n=1 Tax=candidate division KSB3 bacterium TaxID=2044937 RepID=A0A2G6KGC5_9BACT|nr:MAG: DUF2088 domain-containing protein [candidate division KSB3 bacterium]